MIYNNEMSNISGLNFLEMAILISSTHLLLTSNTHTLERLKLKQYTWCVAWKEKIRRSVWEGVKNSAFGSNVDSLFREK